MIVILGTGLAGLTAARALANAGYDDFRLIEQANQLGGRVATDSDGEFLYDVGFAVLNPAYPMVRRYLSLDALGLGYFQSGALLLREGEAATKLMDPIAHPSQALPALLQRYPSWADRFRTLALRWGNTAPERPRDDGPSTRETLRAIGFSDDFVETFFRPFFAGVFLDRELEVSGELFRYLFEFFKKARVALPAAGMRGVAEELARPLPREKFSFGVGARAVEPKAVTLADGSRLEAEAVIVATDERAARALLGQPGRAETRAVTTVYYAADELPWPDKLLALNSAGSRWVNHLAVLSSVQPTYAKKGRHLVSVNGIGTLPPNVSLADWKESVHRELVSLVGPKAKAWKYLRHYVVESALPKRFGHAAPGPSDLYCAGDYLEHPSIEGAMRSGERAAEAALRGVRR